MVERLIIPLRNFVVKVGNGKHPVLFCIRVFVSVAVAH